MQITDSFFANKKKQYRHTNLVLVPSFNGTKTKIIRGVTLRLNDDIVKPAVTKSFITDKNEKMHNKLNNQIGYEDALDLYLTQNVEYSKKYTNKALSWLNYLGIPGEFIGKKNTALSKPICEAIDESKYWSIPSGNEPVKKYAPKFLNFIGRRYRTFREWFPPVKEYSFNQGDIVGDCYFLAAVDALIHKPKGFNKIKNMVSTKFNGNVQVKYPKGKVAEFKKGWVFRPIDWQEFKRMGATGNIWIKAFEQTFAEIKNETPFASKLKKMKKIGEGGYSDEVFNILGLNTDRKYLKENSEDTIRKIVQKYTESSDKFLCAGTEKVINATDSTKYNLIGRHAYSVNGYDSKKDEVIINNPHYNAVEIHVPFDVFYKNFMRLYLGSMSKINPETIKNVDTDAVKSKALKIQAEKLAQSDKLRYAQKQAKLEAKAEKQAEREAKIEAFMNNTTTVLKIITGQRARQKRKEKLKRESEAIMLRAAEHKKWVKEIEFQKQRPLELEKQKEVVFQKQRQLELQKQSEAQKEKQFDLQKQKQLELRKQKDAELQKQKDLEAYIKALYKAGYTPQQIEIIIKPKTNLEMLKS